MHREQPHRFPHLPRHPSVSCHHGADFNKRLLLCSLFSIYIAPHNCLPVIPQSIPVKVISISNPQWRHNKSGRGFRNIHRRTQNESQLELAWTSLPLTYLASSFILYFWLADLHRTGSSWRLQLKYPKRSSLAALSKIAPPPQGLHYRIPAFRDFMLLIATEIILFVYLCSCLLSVFTVQEGHLFNSSSLAWVLFIAVSILFVESTWHTVDAQLCLLSEWQGQVPSKYSYSRIISYAFSPLSGLPGCSHTYHQLFFITLELMI